MSGRDRLASFDNRGLDIMSSSVSCSSCCSDPIMVDGRNGSARVPKIPDGELRIRNHSRTVTATSISGLARPMTDDILFMRALLECRPLAAS